MLPARLGKWQRGVEQGFKVARNGKLVLRQR
jgi:hypothetical protein